MYHFSRIFTIAAFLFLLNTCIFLNPVEDAPLDLNEALPMDPSLIHGELDNGLKYFIKENAKPENRAELRLVINAGSILEKEDQLGLAHLLEHMSFNGTEDFPKMDLINYLESIGMRFGPDINAYTGFDETVYQLQVPTDSLEQFNRGFQILENWAHKLKLDGEDIDMERGVIVEEWRGDQGAGKRMFDKQLPVIFQGSQYAVRLPIGSMDVIQNASHEAVRRFYRDWYRPDLMAIIAVGDFIAEDVEKKIKNLFSPLPSVEGKPERTTFDVPGHQETLYALASDPEATRSSVSILYKHPSRIDKTVADYRASIIERMYHELLNARFNEISQKSDAPFLYAYSGMVAWARTSEMVQMGASVAEGGIEKGLEAVLVEAERIRKYGFTSTELDRIKKDILRSMEKYYQEREKMDSRRFASELRRYFLEEEPVPGIDYEYSIYKEILPEIHVDEVNKLAQQFITDENRVVMTSSPEKKGLVNPTKEDLAAVLSSISSLEIEPYVDKVITEPLLSDIPPAGAVISEKHYADMDVDELILSNGVRVVLKETDFKNDEILFQAFSPGGYSLVADDDLLSARLAATIMDYSGLGNFSLVDLQKMLAGKQVGSTPYISALHEGLRGSVSPEDLELLFQMIYLQFTASRLDDEAVGSLMNQLHAQLQNKSLSPESAYQDTLNVTLNDYHPRRKPITVDMLDLIDSRAAQKIYEDRFADASDFTFLFVGNFSKEQLLPLILQYLAALPSTGRDELWVDEGIETPQGKIVKSVYRGVEPKSTTRMVFSGTFDYSRQERYDIYSMMQILRIRLREVLREDMGGVYGVGVWSNMSPYPQPEYSLTITFGCDPERVEELTEAVLEEIGALQSKLPDQENVEKVKEIQRREREVNIKRNGYWLNSLAVYYREGRDLANFMKFNELIEGFSAEAAHAAAKKYFDLDSMIQVTLYPEE